MMADTISATSPKVVSGPTIGTLPLDVKNKIFSYLLLGSEVVVKEYRHRSARTYKFHTAILQVNKRIGAEAATFLHTRNTFVLFKHEFFDFNEMMDRSMVAYITDKSSLSFKLAALEVNLTWNEMKCICGRPSCLDHTPPSKGRFLMLHEDLDLILLELRSTYQTLRGDHIFIQPSPDPKDVKWWSYTPESSTSLKLKLKKNPYFEGTFTEGQQLTRQKRLLAPFTRLTTRVQKVKICGDVDPILARATSKVMTPRFVWTDAVGWDLVDIIRAQKQALDKVLEEETACMHFLEDAYRRLAGVACQRNHLFCNWEEEEKVGILALSEDPEQVKTSWQLNLLVVGLDCYVTALRLQYRCHYVDAWPEISQMANHATHQYAGLSDHVPMDLRNKIAHFVAVTLAFSWDGSRVDPSARFALDSLKEIREKDPKNRELRADISLVRAMMRGDPDAEKELMLAVGIRDAMCNTLMPEVARPDGLKGWVNVKHELSTEQMARMETSAAERSKKILAIRAARIAMMEEELANEEAEDDSNREGEDEHAGEHDSDDEYITTDGEDESGDDDYDDEVVNEEDSDSEGSSEGWSSEEWEGMYDAMALIEFLGSVGTADAFSSAFPAADAPAKKADGDVDMDELPDLI